MAAGDDLNGDGIPNDFYSPVVTGDPVFDPLGKGDVRFAVRPNFTAQPALLSNRCSDTEKHQRQRKSHRDGFC